MRQCVARRVLLQRLACPKPAAKKLYSARGHRTARARLSVFKIQRERVRNAGKTRARARDPSRQGVQQSESFGAACMAHLRRLLLLRRARRRERRSPSERTRSAATSAWPAHRGAPIPSAITTRPGRRAYERGIRRGGSLHKPHRPGGARRHEPARPAGRLGRPPLGGHGGLGRPDGRPPLLLAL